MSKDYKVVPASEVVTKTRKSPMKIILENIEGDYWTMKEVANHIGVHIETIRRVTKKLNDDGTKYLNAPTSAVRSGEVVIFLFTMADVQEVEEHFERYGYEITRKVDPSKTLREQTVAKAPR